VSPIEKKDFQKQGAEDLQRFLLSRYKELVPGNIGMVS
jgi:hypothetical protein